MKEIQLTQGKVAIVDDADFERINKHKWHAYKAKHSNIFYAIRRIVDNVKKTIWMHREVLNTPKGIRCDHKNGNGLDNQKNNLRDATHTENMCNRRHPHKNNKLGIKGVRWNRKGKKFQAQININGKAIHLGSYNVLGDADSAYRKAEEKYFGEFARAV